ncbi:TetR family transcriptional regulator [Murinocardiopsis flavida]|uniref:TetR family transcriptional regulator n=1 Tax=Murinocardiopsis flavida TaxID=645275 RepID=A0A2P8CRB6_9ACTN|nr:TetR/AcrR family transcriptional regulator C-terminal domain-containing protein [Murinocardiopsis flavida]PSK87492.1 TetR family transcriptional regulator [Murinocardiopsis flavida]
MRLDRERVVRTALRQLDAHGLDGLTLRGIARELDVQAPALYWHFKSKAELLDEMATTMLRDLLAAEEPSAVASWQETLTGSARGLRRMMLAHRDGAKVFSGTHLTDGSIYASQEANLRRLTEAGLALSDAMQGFHAVYSYTVGFAIEEQAVHPRPGRRDERYDPERRDARFKDADLPLAKAAGRVMFTDFDTRFESGLRLIIAGIEHTAGSSPRDGAGGEPPVDAP